MTETRTRVSDRIKTVLMMIDHCPGDFQTLLARVGGGASLSVPSLQLFFTLQASKNKVMRPADTETVTLSITSQTLNSSSQRTELSLKCK